MINESDIEELEELGISRIEIFYSLIESVKPKDKKSFQAILWVTPLLSTPLYE